MLDERLKRFRRQIQAVKLGIAALQRRHDAEAVAVVVEAAMIGQAIGQRILAGMAERRVAEIVAERRGFGEILVEAQIPGDRARDLRHLDGVRQPGAKMVALFIDEHLGLVRKAPEGGRMDDAVAVALIFGARGRGRFGEQPPARFRRDRRHIRFLAVLALGPTSPPPHCAKFPWRLS